MSSAHQEKGSGQEIDRGIVALPSISSGPDLHRYSWGHENPQSTAPCKLKHSLQSTGNNRLNTVLQMTMELSNCEIRSDAIRVSITDALVCRNSTPFRAWSVHFELPLSPARDRRLGTGCPPAQLQNDTQTKGLGFVAAQRLSESSGWWRAVLGRE